MANGGFHKRQSIGLKAAARNGFLLQLKARALREGAFPLKLKQVGITEGQLHAWAVANGMTYLNGIVAIVRKNPATSMPADRLESPLNTTDNTVHDLAL